MADLEQHLIIWFFLPINCWVTTTWGAICGGREEQGTESENPILLGMSTKESVALLVWELLSRRATVEAQKRVAAVLRESRKSYRPKNTGAVNQEIYIWSLSLRSYNPWHFLSYRYKGGSLLLITPSFQPDLRLCLVGGTLRECWRSQSPPSALLCASVPFDCLRIVLL